MLECICSSKETICIGKEDIPKEKIFAIINALCGITVPAPVSIGDILVQDVAGTGVDIVATKNVPAKL